MFVCGDQQRDCRGETAEHRDDVQHDDEAEQLRDTRHHRAFERGEWSKMNSSRVVVAITSEVHAPASGAARHRRLRRLPGSTDRRHLPLCP